MVSLQPRRVYLMPFVQLIPISDPLKFFLNFPFTSSHPSYPLAMIIMTMSLPILSDLHSFLLFLVLVLFKSAIFKVLIQLFVFLWLWTFMIFYFCCYVLIWYLIQIFILLSLIGNFFFNRIVWTIPGHVNYYL